MRTPVQLVRSALGDPSAVDCLETVREVSEFFLESEVELTARSLRALPSRWRFAFLRELEVRNGLPAKVQEEAAHLVKEFAHPEIPLLIISDDPRLRMSDLLHFPGRAVFTLDHAQLSSAATAPALGRHSPLASAVLQRLESKSLPLSVFGAYAAGRPARGWRFFGRQVELEKICESTGSVFVSAGRRMGKTSLLLRCADVLRARGHEVVWADMQYYGKLEDAVHAIGRGLFPAEVAAAVRRSKAVGVPLLDSILKSLVRRGRHPVLILDEFGNLLSRSRRDAWETAGRLREVAQAGHVRILASGFQELVLRQMETASGPHSNMWNVLRLSGFRDPELTEFLLGPLAFWGRVRDGDAFRARVVSSVGRHPGFLQVFGESLLREVFQRNERDVDRLADEVLAGGGLEAFSDIVLEVFERPLSAAARVLFLECCDEHLKRHRSLDGAELSDEWVRERLAAWGYGSTHKGRSLALDELEASGVTERVGVGHGRQRVVTPIVYHYYREAERDVRTYVQRVSSDIAREVAVLNYSTSAADAGEEQ